MATLAPAIPQAPRHATRVAAPRLAFALGASLAVTVAVSLLVAAPGDGVWPWRELGLGWGLATANAALAALALTLGIGRGDRRFACFALGLNGVRFLLVLAALALAVWLPAREFAHAPFLAGVFAGYYSFLVAEIALLRPLG